jgi:hypothetical protein
MVMKVQLVANDNCCYSDVIKPQNLEHAKEWILCYMYCGVQSPHKFTISCTSYVPLLFRVISADRFHSIIFILSLHSIFILPFEYFSSIIARRITYMAYMAARMRIAAMLISQYLSRLSHSLGGLESIEMCFEIENGFTDTGVLIDSPHTWHHNSEASMLDC